MGRTAKRDGMLKAPLLGGKIIAAVDGIEIFHSYRRGCDACCVRRVKIKTNGEEVEVDQFYHRYVVLALMAEDFPLPLGAWPIRPGEDEVAPALELIRQARRQYGPRFYDVLVADGLYLQAPFVQAVRDLGLGVIFTLKENQPCLLEEALQFTNGRPSDRILYEGNNETLSLWDEKNLWWDAAGRDVRVIRCRRERTARERAPKSAKDGHVTRCVARSWTERTEIHENIFAAILDHPASAEGIYRAGKSRWDIDANLFQDLTMNWGLKHMKVHKPVAVMATLLILLTAYTLFMFYATRHVLSRIHRTKPTLIAIAKHLAQSVVSGVPP